jgi:hypothetical protein
MAEQSASSLLLRFPLYLNDEVTFHQFPRSQRIELRELRRLMNTQSEIDINEEDEDDAEYDCGDEESGKEFNFTKRFFQKHGWEFILMQRKGTT